MFLHPSYVNATWKLARTAFKRNMTIVYCINLVRGKRRDYMNVVFATEMQLFMVVLDHFLQVPAGYVTYFG